MKLAVYQPENAPTPLVLAPECLQPSLGREREFGRLRFTGIVELDPRLLSAMALECSNGVEFVVRSRQVADAICALVQMERCALPEGG